MLPSLSELGALAVLGQWVKGPRLPGLGQSNSPPVTHHLDKPFFKIDTGRALFTHGSKLHQMAIRIMVP